MNALLLTNINSGILHEVCPWCCPGALSVLENIKKVAKDYSYIIICNDSKYKFSTDFKYLPERFLRGSADTYRLEDWERQLETNILFLQKQTLSALNSHNKQIIHDMNLDSITVGGFTAHVDVLSTTLSLIDSNQIVRIDPTLLGDISEDKKKWALDYFKWINLY